MVRRMRHRPGSLQYGHYLLSERDDIFRCRGKKKLIDHFFRILERDGFLCLGASETLIGIDERFASVGHFTYQKKG